MVECMGQAFRRASGRIQGSSIETSKLKKPVDRAPPPVSVEKVEVTKAENSIQEDAPGFNTDNVLEERDPQYDVMLSQMVGRIKSKPGGKLEMGEAYVVEKYGRPMPKLRDTTPVSSRFEERPAPTGTLNVAQVRHILLLHQGKAEDHHGSMAVPDIAAKFKVDALQIQKILQTLSLPPESSQ